MLLELYRETYPKKGYLPDKLIISLTKDDLKRQVFLAKRLSGELP